MTFHMYSGDDQERIDHHEEFILDFAARNPNKFLELSKIRDAFYSDPILHDEQSERIAHELIELLNVPHDNKKR